MLRTAAFFTLTAAATTLAQPAITIDVENPVLRPGESTVVTMYAGFSPELLSMAGIGTDFRSSEGGRGLSGAEIIAPMDGPGAQVGTLSATGYDGILAGQIEFLSIPSDRTNPIAFWRVTYTAPAEVSSPFEVELSTLTSRYDVYRVPASIATRSELADLTEGSATIHVIPAPASTLVLACGLLAT
ncbi:MAG: hypothetical protein ACIAQU_10780, partial [Phycisphaerales bacterium JB064]